jgi:hypothetical protein
MSQTALFFLRHYNDIDHVVPVMHAWLSAGHRATAVVYSMPEYLADFRFQMLRKFENFSLHYVDEFLSPPQLDEKKAIIAGGKTDVPKDVRISQVYDYQVLNRIFDSVFATETGPVCFDWIMSTSAAALPVAQRACEIAKRRGLPIVSLPHGDSPHANEMIAAEDLNYAWRDIYRAATIFDSVVVPNELCGKRYRPFMEAERIHVLGSPRYNSAWLWELESLTPTFAFGETTPHRHPERSEGSRDRRQPSDSRSFASLRMTAQQVSQEQSLNLVLFLRSPQYPIFWDEVVRTIRMLTADARIRVVVKHHTRPSGSDPLKPFYDELQKNPIANLQFAFDDVHSGSLLRWCDAVLDVATSVSFEAVKVGKPVLSMEYLHAGYSTVAKIIPSTEMRCRDDVLETVRSLITNGGESYYQPFDRQRFIGEMIDCPDDEVLPRYVSFLEQLTNQATQPAKRSA